MFSHSSRANCRRDPGGGSNGGADSAFYWAINDANSRYRTATSRRKLISHSHPRDVFLKNRLARHTLYSPSPTTRNLLPVIPATAVLFQRWNLRFTLHHSAKSEAINWRPPLLSLLRVVYLVTTTRLGRLFYHPLFLSHTHTHTHTLCTHVHLLYICLVHTHTHSFHIVV